MLIFRLLALSLMTLMPTTAALANDNAGQILERFAGAWRGKQEMRLEQPAVIAISISGEAGGDFTVTLPPEGPGTIEPGVPPEFTVGFDTDIEFLRRLDRGEMSAITAMGQARSSDPTPLRLRVPEGFQWSPAARDFVMPLAFHFWNRQWPEVIAFNRDASRLIHGANAVVFYYQGGVRTGWYQIEPGMHVNRDAADQRNPFKSLLIMTRGEMSSRLDGQERVLREGEAVLIHPGMSHEFWAEQHQQGEAVLVMFGAGA